VVLRTPDAGRPQSLQNRAAGSFCAPQWSHRVNGVPLENGAVPMYTSLGAPVNQRKIA
jgi:hypothetical protein